MLNVTASNFRAQADRYDAGVMQFTAIRVDANKILSARKAMQAGSIAAMEQDRQIVLEGIRAHLHGKCGYYSVSPGDVDADNDELDAYRDCINEWYKIGDNALGSSLVTRAVASSDLSDPRGLVGEGEFARLNREVDAYNSHVRRVNGLLKTASFFRALAQGLSSQ